MEPDKEVKDQTEEIRPGSGSGAAVAAPGFWCERSRA